MTIPINLAAHPRSATRLFSEANEWVSAGIVGQDILATATVYAAQAALSSGNHTVGAVNGTGVAVTERYGIGGITTFTLTAVSIAITDNGAAGGQGSLKIYDFPEGLWNYQGAVVNLTIARVSTGLAATSAVVGSLGSAAAGAGNATLTSTEADYVPSTTCTLTAGAGTFAGVATTALLALVDGTATASDLYLNFATPDAGISATDALLVSGTITLAWTYIGDK